MCRWTKELKIYSLISEIILKKKKRKRKSTPVVSSSFVLRFYSVVVTSTYGISPASKLSTHYFWAPSVVNIFFHFQIILTESFHSKIAPPGNFIKIYQTKPWRIYYLVKSQLRQRFVRVYTIKWHWQRNNFERLRWITKDLQLPRPDRPYNHRHLLLLCSRISTLIHVCIPYVYRIAL